MEASRNRDTRLAYEREWRNNNREKIAAWRLKNKQKINEKKRECYRQRTPNQVRADKIVRREWAAAHPELMASYKKQWKLANPKKLKRKYEGRTAKQLKAHARQEMERRRRDPEKASALHAATYRRRQERALRDPEYRKLLQDRSMRSRYKRLYGITPEQRAAALEAQDHKCLLCDAPNPTATDHCHTTGRFRGVLCTGCNVFVGQMEKSEDRLRRALEYIAKHVAILDGSKAR